MNKEEDYDSESDQSDEDFCPEKEIAGVVSEEEDSSAVEGDDVDSGEEESENEGKNQKVKQQKQRKRRAAKVNSKISAKKTKGNDNDNDDVDDDDADGGGQNGSTRRSTRQTDDSLAKGKKSALEKDELESDEENDKSHSDALWASFLSEVQPVTSGKSTTKASSSSTTPVNRSATIVSSNNNKADEKLSPISSVQAKKVTVTEILNFAGEEVAVQRTVSAESIKENKVEKSSITPTTPKPTVGRLRGLGATGVQGSPGSGAGGSGLTSLLSQIGGKKKKLSVLEKSKLDWNSFKQEEGIDEQLQTFNKGKDGYLERQDFLQRTDVRQFEIERNLRHTRRPN